MTITGVAQLFSGSKALAGKIDTRANREFVTVARRRAVMIAARMPRRSGRMAAAVRGRQGRKGSQALASVGAWKSSVPYLGWIEFGGTRGRPYVPGGRFIYPVGLEADGELKAAGVKTAINEIRGFRWPNPR